MNAKNSGHNDSADPLTDSPLQHGSTQSSFPLHQGSGEQEEQTLRWKAEALTEAPARAEEALTERERERLLNPG